MALFKIVSCQGKKKFKQDSNILQKAHIRNEKHVTYLGDMEGFIREVNTGGNIWSAEDLRNEERIPSREIVGKKETTQT